MATRRPRIKPVANILLNSKRKPKLANDVKVGNVCRSDVNNSENNNNKIEIVPSQEPEVSNNITNLLEVRVESIYDANAIGSNPDTEKVGCKNNNENAASLLLEVKGKTESKNEPNCEIDKSSAEVYDSTENIDEFLPKKDSEAFKCPLTVGFQVPINHASSSGLHDVFYSDIEENALQMNIEKSSVKCPQSPTKSSARTRIRHAPHFGQRRNSYVGSSSSPYNSASEDNPFSNTIVNSEVTQTSQQRRERHHSASMSTNCYFSYHHTPQKYLPAGVTNSSMNRIRTESGCSAYSDNTLSHKLRKIDDHKQTARKDFEARFHNGVPEKSVIKMSDLIFYNPATNPMEQKTTPNVKLEQKETPTNDVKPFIGEPDIDTKNLIDDKEAVPVPQLKLNAKGELILDDKSLVIETTAEQEARKALANSSLIYLDEYTGMNGFYSRKLRTRVWLPSDTIKFYRCLQNVGTDFSLMVSLFPNRTRRDLKLKFKKEEQKNGHLINKALLYPKQFDIEALKQQIDEEEKLRGEQTKDKNIKLKKIKKKINCQSKATRILLNSVYQNENKLEETKKDISGDVPQSKKSDNFAIIQIDQSGKKEHKESEKKIKEMQKSSTNLTEVEKLIRDYDSEKRKRDRYYAIKRRRKRRYYKRQVQKEITIIKEEIKTENKQELNESEFQDSIELEMEMDELLDMDGRDSPLADTYGSSRWHMFADSSHAGQYNQEIALTSPYRENANNNGQIPKYEQKTYINLDDGSLNVCSNIRDGPTPQRSISLSAAVNESNSFESLVTEPGIINNKSYSSGASEPELSEADIQSILTELAEGSLVLVSSLDPDDPDKVLNEIYMVDKNTGDLCEEPLSIPDNIVQCILTVVS